MRRSAFSQDVDPVPVEGGARRREPKDEDGRADENAVMPLDGTRMIFGGFVAILDK